MTDLKTFEEVRCDSAEDFLAELRKSFQSGIRLFRGVSDETYQLVPSAFRKTGIADLERLTGTSGLRDPSTAMDQVLWAPLLDAQIRLLSTFVQRCNRENLLDLNLTREAFEALDGRAAGKKQVWRSPNQISPHGPDFPDWQSLPAYALMQHQGLPTPLLDWSENPFKAAFFAVDKSTDEMGEQLAVYALDQEVFRATEGLEHNFRSELSFFPRLFYPQSKGNSNLQKQSGAFTYLGTAGVVTTGAEIVPVVDLVVAINDFVEIASKLAPRNLQDLYPVFPKRPTIKKLTVPKAEVKKIRTYLVEHGISHSAIYSGFEGVRREIEAGWDYGW